MTQNKQCGIAEEDWNRSAGWVTNVLKRHNLVGITLHGEANDMDDATRRELMKTWLTEFHKLIDDENIEPDCVYNADQTGLYYRKLPNRMYSFQK